MGEVTTIGLDLAKSIFQTYGADPAGVAAYVLDPDGNDIEAVCQNE